jgi:hypothetical protein
MSFHALHDILHAFKDANHDGSSVPDWLYFVFHTMWHTEIEIWFNIRCLSAAPENVISNILTDDQSESPMFFNSKHGSNWLSTLKRSPLYCSPSLPFVYWRPAAGSLAIGQRDPV